jgi:hypothetical protein
MKTIFIGILITAIHSYCLFILVVGQEQQHPNEFKPYYDYYIFNDQFNPSTANDSVLTKIGHWAWGPCRSVEAQGNYAYISNGSTFQVLDFSNPSSPQIVAEYYLGGEISDIKLRDSLAFICNGGYLFILDISRPIMPFKLGEIYIPTSPIRVTLSDSLAFVSTFGGLLFVIDISDLSNPYILDSGSGGGELLWSLASKGRHVYIGSIEDALITYYDVTDPDSLHFRWKIFWVGGSVTSAFIKDSFLFLGTYHLAGEEALEIYDISTPDTLIYVSEVTIRSQILAITVKDSLAYLCAPDSGVYVIDIANIDQPQFKGKLLYKAIDSNFGGSGITVSNSQIYTGYYTGLLVVDASQPDSLVETTFFPTSEISFKITVKDNFAYVASGRAGLWILDISNTEQPYGVANIQPALFTSKIFSNKNSYPIDFDQHIPPFASDVAVKDSIMYFLSGPLWIYNISNPYHPEYINDYNGVPETTPFVINSLALNGNLLFVASPRNDSSLVIVDVSNPLQPMTLSVLSMPVDAHNLQVKDSIAYIATKGEGLRIVNCQDPFNPYEISSLFETKHVGIALIENFAYIESTDSFFVVDITLPQSPSILGRLGRSYAGDYFDMTFSNNYVYWVGGPGVVDVSDPYQPDEIAHYGYVSNGVAAKDDIVIITHRTDGVLIFKNDLISSIVSQKVLSPPKRYELHQNYPNPFNSTTIIEFYAPLRQKVAVDIYNILGEKVHTLLNSIVKAGLNKIYFDSSNLPSGVYFYKLSTPEGSITKKMVLLQ